MNQNKTARSQSIAVIGSFRKHYDLVLRAVSEFRQAGLDVVSPVGSCIIQPNISFVRFVTDPIAASDEIVQSLTLGRIFSARAVFVVAPDGYVGRTTCYEIGRVLERKQPIYFSEHPTDIPLKMPNDHVACVAEVARIILTNAEKWPFSQATGEYFDLERALL